VLWSSKGCPLPVRLLGTYLYLNGSSISETISTIVYFDREEFYWIDEYVEILYQSFRDKSETQKNDWLAYFDAVVLNILYAIHGCEQLAQFMQLPWIDVSGNQTTLAEIAVTLQANYSKVIEMSAELGFNM
jgi:hypothetical protein